MKLKDEIAGGLTAAVLALPVALAFGLQSGLGPAAGLYTAIILAFITTVFGATKGIISDPAVPITIVSTIVVSSAIALRGDLDRAMPLILGTFVLAGVIQIFFGIIKVAKYVRYISYPVLSGFMSGIGVIIILFQWNNLLGHKGPKNIPAILSHFHEPLLDPNVNSLILGVLCLALIYTLPLISRKIPAGITALLICTGLSLFMQPTFAILGEIPTDLPGFKWKALSGLQFSDLSLIFSGAVTIAGLGAINTLLTAVAADTRTKEKHKGNLELVGQGVGNIITTMFGGLPGAGGTVGTLANINAGGRTRVSGFVKVGFLIIVLFALGPLVKYIPIPVVSALLISVGIRIMDIKGIVKLLKIRNSDLLVLCVVLFLTVVADLLVAIGVGMVLSSFFFMQQMGSLVEEQTKYGELGHLERKLKVPKFLKSLIYIIELDGPLFYGFSDEFKTEARKVKGKQAVLINMSAVPYIDASGIFMLEEVIQEFRQVGVEVVLVGVKPHIFKNFEDLKFIPKILPEQNVYNKTSTGIKYLVHKLTHEI
jgi:SulP family sulfate permease